MTFNIVRPPFGLFGSVDKKASKNETDEKTQPNSMNCFCILPVYMMA